MGVTISNDTIQRLYDRIEFKDDPDVKVIFDEDRTIYTKIQDEAPTIYRSHARVKHSLIATGCVIDGTVENSVIFRSTRIGKGAVVKNSIVMQNSVIEANSALENAICDKYSHVSAGTKLGGTKDSPIVIAKNQNI